MRIIPVELDTVFERLRINNQFRFVDGLPIWTSVWHDTEFGLIDQTRITNGTDEFFYVDGEMTEPQSEETILTPKYPFYEYGSIREVVEIVCKEVGMKKDSRFPLILLATLDEPYNRIDDIDDSFNAVMYIVIKTNEDLTPKERYDTNYELILAPYWEMIKKYLDRGCYFYEKEEVTFRERWGKNGLYDRKDNVFNNMVDALEVKLKLTFKN